MKFVATFKTNEGIDKTFEIGENIGLDDAYRVVANNHLTTQSIEINPNMDYTRKMHLGGDMTYREYVNSQFDENEDRYLPSDFLGDFEISTDRKSLHPILYSTKNGYEYRLRNNISSSIGVFDGDKMIGYADNKAIMVEPSYQKKGIGLELVTILKERNPNHRFGSMTPAGWNLLGKYYDKKIAKKSNDKFDKGGEIENLIDQGEIELKVYPTTPKHANLYGLKSENPLYIQSIFISENQRLKGIGKKVLKYLNDFAIENGHDVMFGHITQKASFSKDDSRQSNLDDVAMIKNWLQSNGYEICEGNNDFYKVVNNPDIRFDKGGELGYLLDNEIYKRGGRTIAQTPAPKKDRVYGSKTNPKGSAKDKTKAQTITFSPILLKSIKNKIDAHNSKYPTKKVNLATAKAVVRRGMGAYSKSHRPTISGGAPNSRQAWGIARLNKFLLKKAGYRVKRAYIQDDDLL